MLNEKYSFKDFTKQTFVDVPAEEFNGTIIKGSCFAQEIEYENPHAMQNVFPAGMRDVTFVRCNLDNVDVVGNNVVMQDCANRRIKIQNDAEDWVLDNAGNPVEPVAVKMYQRLGLSIDPANLPNTLREGSILRGDK